MDTQNAIPQYIYNSSHGHTECDPPTKRNNPKIICKYLKSHNAFTFLILD